jgi:hypothetical protein
VPPRPIQSEKALQVEDKDLQSDGLEVFIDLLLLISLGLFTLLPWVRALLHQCEDQFLKSALTWRPPRSLRRSHNGAAGPPS